MKNNRIKIIFGATAILLCFPLIAMQFTDQVNWTFLDFLVMGMMLLGLGFSSELITRIIKNKSQRIMFYVLFLLVFLLVWAELAVGIFGTTFAGS